MASDDSADTLCGDSNSITKLLPLGAAALLTLLLGAIVVTLAMVLALRRDVNALELHARKAAKAESALRRDIAALHADFGDTQRMPAPPAMRAEMPETATARIMAPETVAGGAARPIRVNAAAGRDCIFQPGDPYGLADCIRRQERSRSGAAPVKYRRFTLEQ